MAWTDLTSFDSGSKLSSAQMAEVASNFGALAEQQAGAPVIAPSSIGTPAANKLYRHSLCKGWVNFNGTGTIAIRDSHNVTSLTDNGTGDYTVNWNTDFADINYSVGGMATEVGVSNRFITIGAALTVGATRVRTVTAGGANTDSDWVTVQAMGNQ